MSTNEVVTKVTPTTEVVHISPETLEVANCYLQLQDVRAVAEELDMPIGLVSEVLGKREVKAYIDHVFLDVGYNNRFKMRSAMDAIIMKKFQDMEEAGVGSSKDIMDLMALSHKMAMEHMAKQIELEKIRLAAEENAEKNRIRTQVNVQVNNEAGSIGGNNYATLINRLIENS